MNKIFLLIGIFFLVNTIFAQDKIIMLAGDTLNVQITKTSPEHVDFKYPKESLVNSKEKSEIEKIIYSSGRIEVVNEKVALPIIKSKDDWEKVIITFDENDILGLRKCCDIIGKSNWGALASVKGGKKAMEKMRKEAAEKGASIILIVDGWHHEKGKPISGYARGVKLTGVAYK